ncbi:uncharacterized protein LOC122085411 [Macadamia integrifolia]|uniref:uncharacterized protein LOC122085411 n=1 Tax=Macadamia integrifolia TaxID=60698 RepID=UPI001C4F0886|nr:uncharacterized protein LOC122085411 [Macadamia integrifolia]XP_042509765.1 uncharacterized protein LOC122085411 [Macadamia integrifolia]XP_042509766.1 uncharacterized protein LOC122085411 [Macadamia integrifolia]XP_042509767.1 uncharacterized protein LOC122085411 [Macadamia integrifolia]XP_042509768.1 uncharacterized protein LOC122085411 [Macadamia integrifolia]XP_042509769.1 uncharacterized protein LOC122085411 [Macadamia integrifolia]
MESTQRGRMGSAQIIASNVMVPEVLTEDNYEFWKMYMKSYLLGEELWRIVEGTCHTPEPSDIGFNSWKQGNGKALHAIQISCGQEMVTLIKDIDSAKAAWDHLAFKHQEKIDQKNLPAQAGTYSTVGDHEDGARYLPLYQIVFSGDWQRTKNFLEENPEAMTARISVHGMTALQLAAIAGHLEIVEEMVKLMDPEALEIKSNYGGATVLIYAAIGGITKIAEVLVRKNGDLVHIPNLYGLIPVSIAGINGNKDMVRYLYSLTSKDALVSGECKNGATLLTTAIDFDMYDIALDLLRCYPILAVSSSSGGMTAIESLAQKPYAFRSGRPHNIWQRWIYSYAPIYKGRDTDYLDESSKDQNHITKVSCWLYGVFWCALNVLVPGVRSIHRTKRMHIQALKLLKCVCSQISILDEAKVKAVGVYSAIFQATKSGIVEIIVELIKKNPNFVWCEPADGRRIFQIAVLYRQEKIFNLIYGIGALKNDLAGGVDNDGNNILHFAGMVSPQSQLYRVSGAALQMQRELQWFQEVDMITRPPYRDQQNSSGLKPRELFKREHKELLKEGETWMKDTANSCMVVAALIATFTFAAVFTIPGGSYQDGFPIFLRKKLFLIFIISDASSLFSSATSVLMFLSILTSRYAEEDFLKSLPKRLIIGLSTLFISMATMMVAFCATLFLILGRQYRLVAILITFLAGVPVTLFVLLQFPLFLAMVHSTYGHGIFNRQAKLWLY